MKKQEVIDFIKKGNPSKGLSYEIYGDHAVVIGFRGKQKVVSIPSTIKGLPVTRIRDCAFAGCEHIAAINIPDSVKQIENFAFIGCPNLKEVNIPKHIKIDTCCFYPGTKVVIR